MACNQTQSTSKKFQKQKSFGDSENLLCREDFDGGPISLNEIENGLYLGNLTAATHIETLKNYKITHILTVDSVPLPVHIVEQSFLTTKYVHISDMPKEDILHHFDECIHFIDSALEKGENILVHCYFGVSRSSTIIIAYIMKKYNLEYSQAFEQVKSKRKYVQPNDGFVFQLKLYRRMGYKIDSNYPKYKTYRLRLAADKVRKAKILPQSCMDLIKPDPGIAQESPEPIVYRCRKCRRIIVNKSNLMLHQIKPNSKKDNEIPTTNICNKSTATPSSIEGIIDKIANNELRKCSIAGATTIDEKSCSENDDGNARREVNCNQIIFIEPIAWMKDIIHETQGRLNCPKCNQKLGSFSWINGVHCPCGAEIAPAFYLIPSKVELSRIVQNLQRTI